MQSSANNGGGGGGATNRSKSASTVHQQKCFIKIVAIGDSGVGKTSLIQMFENAKFTESFKPTIGADFSNKEIRTSTGRLVTLQIWDTAGQERYQSLGTAFYRGADCCLLVYDLTSKQSFENVLMWKNNFLSKSMVSNPDSFPFLVVGNKLDLEQSQRSVAYKQLEKFSKENGEMLFVEASAKSNLNVEQAFQQVAELALERQAMLQRQQSELGSVINARNNSSGRSGQVVLQ